MLGSDEISYILQLVPFSGGHSLNSTTPTTKPSNLGRPTPWRPAEWQHRFPTSLDQQDLLPARFNSRINRTQRPVKPPNNGGGNLTFLWKLELYSSLMIKKTWTIHSINDYFFNWMMKPNSFTHQKTAWKITQCFQFPKNHPISRLGWAFLIWDSSHGTWCPVVIWPVHSRDVVRPDPLRRTVSVPEAQGSLASCWSQKGFLTLYHGV